MTNCCWWVTATAYWMDGCFVLCSSDNDKNTLRSLLVVTFRFDLACSVKGLLALWLVIFIVLRSILFDVFLHAVRA